MSGPAAAGLVLGSILALALAALGTVVLVVVAVNVAVSAWRRVAEGCRCIAADWRMLSRATRAAWQACRKVPVPADGKPLDRDEARVLMRTGQFLADKSEVRRAAVAEVRHWERLLKENR